MENINSTGTMGDLVSDVNSNFSEASIKDVAFANNVVSTVSGDIITPDGADGNFFDIYLNRPTTNINMPINIRSGETYRFQVRQDMVGGRVIKWGSKDSLIGVF